MKINYCKTCGHYKPYNERSKSGECHVRKDKVKSVGEDLTCNSHTKNKSTK